MPAQLSAGVIIVAIVAASINWYTRLPGSSTPAWVEWVSKPLVTFCLIVAAATVDAVDPTQRWWFVVGLVLCLLGDVALMLPTELFRTGLVSFLLGHLAFVVGFSIRGIAAPVAAIVFAVVVLGVCLTIAARHLLPNIKRRSPELVVPVAAYVAVIASMATASIWGQHWAAPLGAATFAVSDLTLADNKFVAARRWSPLAVMVTYHVALALLVWSLKGAPQ